MQLREVMLESLQAVPINEARVNSTGETDTLYDESMDLGFSQKTYTQLENSKTWSSKIVTSRGNVDLGSWTMTHPEQWTTGEVLDWIFSVVQLIEDFQFENFRGEKFNKLNGRELCCLSRDDFCLLEPTYGDKLFSILDTMLRTASFKDPGSLEDIEFQPPQDFSISHQVTEPNMVDEIYRGILMNNNELVSSSTFTIADHEYDFSPYDSPSLPDPPLTRQDTSSSNDNDPGYSSSCSEGQIHNDSLHGCLNPGLMFSTIDPASHIYSQDVLLNCPELPNSQMIPSSMMNISQQTSNPASGYIRRGPGRPRRKPRGSPTSDYDGSDTDGSLMHKARTPGTHKGAHLWEFIRDLLKNHPSRNDLIRWENKDDGVFRIINSREVAKLWGQKKNNHTMTYEKFSRSMRYCRTAGHFSDVPKTGNYPKKLCFKFGPKSFGWED